jgi:hypothetical protein
VEDFTALQSGKLGKGLKKFLTSEIVDKAKGKESLVVIEPHLGTSLSIAKPLGLSRIFSAFNIEEARHFSQRKCRRWQPRRPLAWYSGSAGSTLGWTRPEGFSHHELGSEPFSFSVTVERTFTSFE